jgi:hypothetical protein
LRSSSVIFCLEHQTGRTTSEELIRFQDETTETRVRKH